MVTTLGPMVQKAMVYRSSIELEKEFESCIQNGDRDQESEKGGVGRRDSPFLHPSPSPKLIWKINIKMIVLPIQKHCCEGQMKQLYNALQSLKCTIITITYILYYFKYVNIVSQKKM